MKDTKQTKVTDFFKSKVKTSPDSAEKSTPRSSSPTPGCSHFPPTGESTSSGYEVARVQRQDSADSLSAFEFEPLDFSYVDFEEVDAILAAGKVNQPSTSSSTVDSTSPDEPKRIEGGDKALVNLQALKKSYKVKWGEEIPADLSFIAGSKFFIEGVVPVSNFRYRSNIAGVDSIRVAASRMARGLIIKEYDITIETFKGRGRAGEPSISEAICRKLGWEALQSYQEAISHLIITHCLRLNGKKVFDKDDYTICCNLISQNFADRKSKAMKRTLFN
ncbi:uncharacterized protein LOC128390768 [Panonychus citri]|uniref:uncharacterized protein LOC128390768 n=1 Tax=Panonychus citri TaxID=50023 RepID=UPI0023075E4D|nr:uncharacterized protein LOC128390768 [Panonychus citri]